MAYMDVSINGFSSSVGNGEKKMERFNCAHPHSYIKTLFSQQAKFPYFLEVYYVSFECFSVHHFIAYYKFYLLNGKCNVGDKYGS